MKIQIYENYLMKQCNEWEDWNGEQRISARVSFQESLNNEFGFEKILNWVNELNKLISTYKWSQFINATTVFTSFSCIIESNHSEISLHCLEQLNALCNLDKDKRSFAKTVQDKFIKFVALNCISSTPMQEESTKVSRPSDDIPF